MNTPSFPDSPEPPEPPDEADSPEQDDAMESEEGDPTVVQSVDAGQLQHFVTTIKSAEQQVGENIIHALRHDGTVAVLTTVIIGPDGQQQVISAALGPSMMAQVQQVLRRAQQERMAEDPCVGFHCLVRPKEDPKNRV